MFASSVVRRAAGLCLMLVLGCYDRPSTAGLVCEFDEHCDGAQSCETGICVERAGASDALECSAQGEVYCGYGECSCPSRAPYCCGDGRCYDTQDGCASTFSVTECPGGGDCTICRAIDGMVDFCEPDTPYCCFENGPAGASVFCNSVATACGGS